MPSEFTLQLIFVYRVFNECFVYLPLIVYCGSRVNLQVFIWPSEQFEFETPDLDHTRASQKVMKPAQFDQLIVYMFSRNFNTV